MKEEFNLSRQIKIEKSLPKNYPGCERRYLKRPCEDLEGLEICYYCGRDLMKNIDIPIEGRGSL